LRRRLKALGYRLLFITAVEDEAAHREQWSGLRRCSRKSFPAKVLIGAIDKATG
jgi:hypothetical protein